MTTTDTMVRLARITDQPLDATEVEQAVTDPTCGATVVFTGTVRNHDGGQAVSALEYSAHPHAERFLLTLCAELAAAHNVPVAAVHRIGALGIGDRAVVVAVAAAHRDAAFAACSQLVDRIKHEVPIWKRQLFADGLSEWVNAGG
ncbi:molybdenum cofactor biosynthesis protein MoaE [Nocardia sp. CNY236]|uniref:molybdenum cofactor biosynthesis protein MoaE n=1 Tax=Nocardia sp. CNY236 TaxID=1169152 RepID=UPI0004922074|nr:molybdenum cofactor biosynthesis protein MoaE [Nocardia sp. CNY236]